MTTPSTPSITDQGPIDELTYEAAFSALETVVTALESEKQSLEDALALFERGQLLIRRLSFLLDQAELKVQQLSGGEIVDFNPNPQG